MNIYSAQWDATLSYGENPESLSHLSLNRYRVVTDRQTDGRTDRIMTASTRLALRAVERKDYVNLTSDQWTNSQ